MIFAAGIGSRLKPFTDNKPKALVEVNGKALLAYAIDYLKSYGITDVVINIHHFGQQIIDFCNNNNFNINITISDETNELLDTGGGLKKASNYFSGIDPIVVVNADILTDVNLDKMRSQHINSGNVATLAVRDRNSGRKLVFNAQKQLIGWKNIKTSELIEVQPIGNDNLELAFSGLQIISPKIYQHFPDKNKFSIIELYLELAKFQNIGAYIQNEGYWFDVGSNEKLQIANDFFK